MLPKHFTSSNTTNDRNRSASLALESLEDRMMLSSVQIFAAGTTGTESLDLRINDVVVSTFENVGGDASNRQFQQLTFDTPQNISAGEVRLEFTNDLFRPEDGFDRNIVIDRIVVDGVTFETESPSTFSTGVFRDGGVTDAGFLQTETLNINGSFFYSNDGASAPTASTGTTLQIKAFGSTGEEQLQVRINGEVVQTFSVKTTSDTYTFVSDQQISVDQVQVEFTNDLFDPNNSIDRNLIVEQIQLVDRQTNQIQTFITDSDSTFSTGTFLAADGIVDGFGRGNTLHANGFFRFAQTNNSTESLVIDASFGDGGFVSDSGANLFSSASDSAVSPSGRIAIIGASGGDPFTDPTTTDLFLFDADGTLINQTTVGPGGRAFPNRRSVEFGPDESIFLNFDLSRSQSSEIVKLTPEGNLDASFGTNGTLRLDENNPSSLAVTSDGDLIRGGNNLFQFVGSVPSDTVVTKRDAQGNLDETFGGDGRVVLDNGFSVIEVVPTSDGGVYFVGMDGQQRRIVRISADGTPVSSYGSNGNVFLDPQENSDGRSIDNQVLVDSQDRLILTTRIVDDRTEIQRFSSDGQVDTSFGEGGTVTLSPDFEGFVLDTDGRILGFQNFQAVPFSSNFLVSIFRLDENGNFDASFADSGSFVTAADTDRIQTIESIQVGSDGSIVATSPNGLRRYVLV